MQPRRRLGIALPMISVLAITLAACGGGGGGGSSNTPVQGGTLKLLGASDVDHLDTASAYYTTSYTLERAFTHQLFSYPASTDLTTSITPVSVAAAETPTTTIVPISAVGMLQRQHVRRG